MELQQLQDLRRHPAWMLVAAHNATFIVGFLHFAFIKNNSASCRQSELVGRLDDYRHLHRETLADSLPKSSLEYLDDWAGSETAFLRKYYPAKGDEPEFDLTPASESAIEWLAGLKGRPFVGTESRLMTIFELLRDVVQFAGTDPARRMAALEKKRTEIDQEISRLKAGQALHLEPTKVKERYFQLEDMARRLFADFRQVEENFRELDRRARERIATSNLTKGSLLDEILGEEYAIANSDQGRSFKAFWELLLSPARQQELEDLTGHLMELQEVRDLSDDAVLPRLKYRLMEAGEKVKRMLDSLVEHLRRFLDDRARAENRRILDLIRSIERRAVDLRNRMPEGPSFMELDDVRPDLNLTMARGLASPSKKVELEILAMVQGEADFEADALYNIHYVDEFELQSRIDDALLGTPQVSLEELIARHPLSKGLSELITYIHIASKGGQAVFDLENVRQIRWRDDLGQDKAATVPQVIFVREIGEESYERA